MKNLGLILLLGFVPSVGGQRPSVTAQREAMKKLDFLVGQWSGELWMNVDPPLQSLRLPQTEDVQFKMDGLLIVMEGVRRNMRGDAVLQSFATISYDDVNSSYRLHLYAEGMYVDTELKVTPQGFAWGVPAGVGDMSDTMRLNEKGEWAETSQLNMGATAIQSVETLLRRQAAVLPDGPPTVQRFDGKWLTTVSCEAARDALGYSFRFVSEVKDGNLRGQQGIEGQPSSLRIEGKINADGSGKLYATGRTGSKEFVPGRDTPRGTEYNYTIEARFKGGTGTGTRIEGRPCSWQFEKQ